MSRSKRRNDWKEFVAGLPPERQASVKAKAKKLRAVPMRGPSLGEETFARDLRAHGLTMEREVRFHPERQWLADFLSREHMIIVEIEGGTKGKSRHTSAKGFADDCEKYNAATEMGYRVFRYPTEAVKSGEAIAQIERVLS